MAQRDDRFLHLARTHDQILPARSDFHAGKSGAFVPCTDAASQLPVNNTVGLHYASNSYPFTDKSGKSYFCISWGFLRLPIMKPFKQFICKNTMQNIGIYIYSSLILIGKGGDYICILMN